MHLIIIAVVIVSVIGLIAGLGLAVASKVMAVPVDEKAEEIQAALPGANCGACG
ncbi:MAG TPA: ferredoxin, partial [Ruminococcaceae bacterium]|nr:ferredoxin [Oscillospiraceae bacterium]